MTLEEYKALAAKAAAGDQQAIVEMTAEGERLFGVEETSAKAIADSKAEADKAKHLNAQLMISMYGRSDPGSPAGQLMEDKDKSVPPEFVDENGFRITGVQYALKYAEHCMAGVLEGDKE